MREFFMMKEEDLIEVGWGGQGGHGEEVLGGGG